MTVSAPPLARRSLVDAAVDQLRRYIEEGRWPVGSRIPTEPELVGFLQISRNTVREAIRVLSVSGMLEVRQGDGTYVRTAVDAGPTLRELCRADLAEHLEARAVLEAATARLAALRRTPADLEQLTAALARRGERSGSTSLDDFVAADLSFHQGIARAAGNRTLAELYEFFARSIGQNLRQRLIGQDLPEPDLASHEAILDAIRRQDADGAAAAARAVTAPIIEALRRQGGKDQ